jgi:hypothetical protein
MAVPYEMKGSPLYYSKEHFSPEKTKSIKIKKKKNKRHPS